MPEPLNVPANTLPKCKRSHRGYELTKAPRLIKIVKVRAGHDVFVIHAHVAEYYERDDIPVEAFVHRDYTFEEWIGTQFETDVEFYEKTRPIVTTVPGTLRDLNEVAELLNGNTMVRWFIFIVRWCLFILGCVISLFRWYILCRYEVSELPSSV